MGCDDSAEFSDCRQTIDAGAGAAAKAVDGLTHLLRNLHKQIAQRCVVLPVEHQMLTMPEATSCEQHREVLCVVRIGVA